MTATSEDAAAHDKAMEEAKAVLRAASARLDPSRFEKNANASHERLLGQLGLLGDELGLGIKIEVANATGPRITFRDTQGTAREVTIKYDPKTLSFRAYARNGYETPRALTYNPSTEQREAEADQNDEKERARHALVVQAEAIRDALA